MFFVDSPCASMEIRSFPGSLFTRSFQSWVKDSRHSMSSARRCSSESMMPMPGPAVATSDQRVSLRRSSKGKSKRVASICAVSSMETLSTQLKASPTGSSSRIFPARSRIKGSRFMRFRGDTTPCTVLRWTSCLGWSMAMNMGSLKSSSSSLSVMPVSDEKIWWDLSTCMMSS